jgi:hypothetical protein
MGEIRALKMNPTESRLRDKSKEKRLRRRLAARRSLLIAPYRIA